MASYGSWVLLLALCIWSCSISTGEGAATGASEALFDSTRERLSTDPATESIEQTVGPGEAPGRRRRADARRRTHTPEKSTAEKANDERIAQQKAVETIKRAREEAIETAQRKEAVIAAEKKIRYDKARARIEASVAQVTRMQRKARQDLDEAKIAMEKRVQLEA